jgi:hypothetical protein
MVWYQLVANPTLNIVVWCSIGFFVLIVGAIIYFIQEWLRSDWLVFVNKDQSINIEQRIVSKEERISGQLKKGKHTYLLEPQGVHTTKSFPQWKKIYVFDEGSPLPRKVEYKKDAWFSTETVQKILNDTRIKMLTKEPIDANLKLFIILGAIGGILGALSSAVILLIELGVIGKQ